MQVLQQLEERHPGAQAYHFIEDKLSTLEKARWHIDTKHCSARRGIAATIKYTCAVNMKARSGFT